MNKKPELTRAYLKGFRDRLNGCLAELGESEGLTLETSNIRYTGTTFTIKVEGTVAGNADEAARIQFKAALDKKPFMFAGLTADDYGKEFSAYGETYRLVGLKPRSPKYPLVVETGGKTYKMRLEAVMVDESVWNE